MKPVRIAGQPVHNNEKIAAAKNGASARHDVRGRRQTSTTIAMIAHGAAIGRANWPMGRPAWLPTMSEIKMTDRPSPGASNHERNTPKRGLASASKARPTRVQRRKIENENASASME